MSAVATAAVGRNNGTMLAIGLTLLSYFLFSFHDAAIKWLTLGLTVWQILFVRSLVIVVCSVAIGRGPLLRRAWVSPIKRAMALRGCFILAAWLLYYNAAKHLQLAEIITIYFGTPVLMMLMAGPLLGEKVTGWNWVAVTVGFAGVLVACDPFGGALSWPMGMALLASIIWAFAFVLLRRIAKAESSLLQMLYSNGFFLLGTAVALPFVWVPPDLEQTLLMLGVGTLGALAQFSIFEAVRRAPVSVLAAFEYTALIWAFVLGWAIWGDWPRDAVFWGALLILASGVMVVLGERRRARSLA